MRARELKPGVRVTWTPVDVPESGSVDSVSNEFSVAANGGELTDSANDAESEWFAYCTWSTCSTQGVVVVAPEGADPEDEFFFVRLDDPVREFVSVANDLVAYPRDGGYARAFTKAEER